MKADFQMKLLLVLIAIFCLCQIALPQDSNVIYACYQKNSGQLRIAQSANACQPSESPIAWNMAGIRGPAGLGNPKVVDGGGYFIGYLFSDGTEILRPVGEYFVKFQASTLGNPNLVAFFYSGPGCSGAEYISANDNADLTRTGYAVGPKLYYTRMQSEFTVKSVRWLEWNGKTENPLDCYDFAPGEMSILKGGTPYSGAFQSITLPYKVVE
jgi:hypothetical protein